MGEVTVEVSVSDYKVFDGVKVPTRMVQRVAGQEIVISFDNLKFNESMPADRFEPPAEIKALLNKPAEKK